jgi:cytochrome c2
MFPVKFAAVKNDVGFNQPYALMHQLKAKLVILAAVLTVILSPQNSFAQDAAKLFKGNCASCHKVTNARSIGPGLLGVKGRWPDQGKLIEWVKNSQALVKAGYPKAVELFEEYKTIMPAQPLSEAEIVAVLDWADKGGDAVASGTDIKGPPEANPPGTGAANNQTYQYILMGLGVLLLLLVIVLGTVRKSLQSLVDERRGIITEPKPVLSPYQRFRVWASNNKKIVAVISLILIIWVLKQGWDGLMGVGVYQGYAPEQPIRFSHKLHAGDNKISCVYCHNSVEKSKHANIPSANVCMNCHMYIQEGPTYGKTEIQKIYTALDYNPTTMSYGPNQTPIEWIRVHSLPDLAYFNHSQHVSVGKIECKQCHGPIDSMEVVRQHSPLTMGWCIDCHRATEVDFKGNKYYEEMHANFVNDPDYKKGDKFTIGRIGGLECSKCHY